MRERLVIGHRGAAGLAPENTLTSFRRAVDVGADMIELDVRKTSDDHLVCIHDDDVSRTTDGEGLVSELTFNEIKSLKIQHNERIPLLIEVLDFARGRIGVDIEIKVPGIEKQILKLIIQRNMEDSVFISSFQHSVLTQIRNLNPKIQTSVLLEKFMNESIAYVKSLKGNVISPPAFLLVSELVQLAHEADLKVYPYVVNDDEYMLELLNMGVDGLITDFPDTAARVVDAFLTQNNV